MADGPNIRDLNTEEEVNKVLEQRTQILNDLSAAYAEEGKRAKEAVSAEIAYIDAKERGSSQLEFYQKRMEDANKKLADHEKEIQKAILAEELLVRALRDQQKAVQAAAEEQAAYTAGLVETTKQMESLAAVDMTKFLQFGKSLKDTKVNLSAVAGAITSNLHSVMDLQTELGRTAGFYRGFNDEILNLKKNNQDLYLTNDALFKIYGSLSNNLTQFLSLSKDQRTATAELASQFSFLGVNADDTSKILDSMSYAFGLNVESSLAAADGLRDIALETGRSLPSVTQELSGMTSQLARFGKRGPEVFRKLAIQARQLGLTIKDAFDLSEQFDTFESAANVAGRLNAQLGMQLNSVEIMSASSEERLDILREEFKLQGLNFQTMGRRQKQMVAEIVAGGDIEKASRLFGGKVDVKKTETRESINAKNLHLIAERSAAIAQRATDDIAYNKDMQDLSKSIADTLGRFQPLIFGAISAFGLLNTFSNFRNMRNMTNRANMRSTSSANIASTRGAGPNPGNLKPSSSSPTGFRDASGRFAKPPTPTPSTPAPKPTSMLRGGGFVKGIGIGGAATGVIEAGFSAHREYQESKSVARAATRGVLSGGGAMAGMAAGAAVGSIIPGLGTVVGGLAGLVLGTAGAWLGSKVGNKAADAILGSPKGKNLDKEAKKATKANLEQRKHHAKSLESMNRMAVAKSKQVHQMRGDIILNEEKMGTFVTKTVDNAASV